MSYLGRITGRMAGPAGVRPALVPSGRVLSPLARRDQRLHAIGTESPWTATAGAADARVPGLGADDALVGIDGEPIDALFAPASAPAPAADAAGAPPGGAGVARAAQAWRPGTVAPPAPGSFDARAARTYRDDGPTALEAAAPGPGAAVPSGRQPGGDAAAGHAGADEARRSGDRSPLEAAEDRGAMQRPRAATTAGAGDRTRAAGAAARESLGAAAATAAADGAAAGDWFSAALTDVLGKVDRWMAGDAKPRQPAQTTGEAGPVVAPAAHATTAPRRPAPRPGLGATAGAYRPAAAPARLSVGRIDVQVVPPPAAPVIAPRVAAARASHAPAASSGESSVPSYLTFGLRQR